MDAGAVAADVDHLVRVGTALDVVVGVDGWEAAGEVRPQVAEALIEAGHGGFLLVESESSGRQGESRSSRASRRSGSWGLQMTMSSAKRA